MDFPDHFKHLFQQLNQQRVQGQLFCDCVVSVGAHRYHAHRAVLAACSSHFRALLSTSAEEEGGGGDEVHHLLVVDQEVVTPEAFSALLEMIYTSTLAPGASNVMDVLLAASHLHLNAVVKACKLHLSEGDFPTSPPEGWRAPLPLTHSCIDPSEAAGSMQQLGLVSPQHLQFSLGDCFPDASPSDREAGTEVSQSGGGLDAQGEMDDGGIGRKQNTAPPAGHKRTSPVCEEDRPSGGKKKRLSREDYRECPANAGRPEKAGVRHTADSPLPESRGEEEEEEEESQEEKYEATKRESEEMELPSQSDGDAGGVEVNSDAVVKVQVGEEKQEVENVAFVEVKRENLSASSPEIDPLPDRSPSPDGLPDVALSDERTRQKVTAVILTQMAGAMRQHARNRSWAKDWTACRSWPSPASSTPAAARPSWGLWRWRRASPASLPPPPLQLKPSQRLRGSSESPVKHRTQSTLLAPPVLPQTAPPLWSSRSPRCPCSSCSPHSRPRASATPFSCSPPKALWRGS